LCSIAHPALTSACVALGSIRAIEPAAPIVPTLGYRPGLDGLRAFAVVAVLLYHGDVSWARGGFVGVDVFFVLSGFLITSLLLTEHEATGRVDLRRFWTRRARRLLPALSGVLLGVALYAAVWGQPTELGRIRGDGIASLFYVSNWRFVLDGSSYFSLFEAPSPLAHTWSLAIEEQWYVLWPPVLLGVLRVLKVRLHLVAATCVALAAGSAALTAMLFHAGADPSRAYYGTDTRAQALLIGAALAALARGGRPVLRLDATRRSAALSTLGVAGAIALVGMVVFVDAESAWLYRGGFLLVALAAVALVAAAATGGVVARALAWRPLVAVGAISYGLYLWHWPVDVVFDASRTGLAGVALLTVRAAVTFALAISSYRLLELPIRQGGFAALTRRAQTGARRAVVPALAACLAAAIAASTLGAVSVPSVAQLADSQAVARVAPDPARTRVLMLGDSQMLTLMFYGRTAFMESGPQYQSAAIVGCGVFDPGMQAAGSCGDRARTWRQAVRVFDPDLSVLLVGAWETLDFVSGGHVYAHGTPEHELALVAIVTRAIAPLLERGGRVALLEVPPFGNPNGERLYGPQRADPGSVAAVNGALQAVAAVRTAVTFVPWADAIAPDGRYTAEVDGVTVRLDGVHVSGAPGARLATDRLVPILRRLAVGAHEARTQGGKR
jgi:peptidoglycan/LPS O-acetylase OafA/YrhL